MSWRDLVREELKGLEPFRVDPAHVRVRLDANESPLTLPPSVREEMARVLADVALNRYPDILAGELRAHEAEHLGVAPEQLLFGNGSDEIIALLVQTFARPRKNQKKAAVCYPTPSFVIYRTAAIAAGSMPLEVPLRPDFTLDEVALERAIVAGQPNLLFLARPNNPTGTLWPREVVEKLAKTHPGLMVIADEAYHLFAGEHCLDLIEKHENVLVLRTLSKVGLAGLRVGFLVGRPEVVHEVEKVRPPYNVGVLPQRAAAFVLTQHADLLRAGVEEVVAERERLSARLAELGATVFPSKANFVMVRVAEASAVWRSLVDHGVLVKNFDRAGTPLFGCLRITIGTRPENDVLLEAMAAAMAEHRAAPPAEPSGATAWPGWRRRAPPSGWRPSSCCPS